MSRPTLLVAVMSVWIAGCDQPSNGNTSNIVAAPSNISLSNAEHNKQQLMLKYQNAQPVPKELAMSKQVANAPNVLVTSTRDGQFRACLDFERGATLIEYGKNGLLRVGLADGTKLVGSRYEINMRTDLAVFQFGKDQPVKLYKTALSAGSAAEIFDDAQTGQPAMRCFRRIFNDYLWFDSDQINVVPHLVGQWACDGPLGSFTWSRSGIIAATNGSASSFLWRDRQTTHLTVLGLKIEGAAHALSTADYSVSLDKVSAGTFAYRAAGHSGTFSCSKGA